MLVRFGHSVVDAMPQREYDAQDDAWRELDEDTRDLGRGHDARVALTLAAACFAAGTCITRCYVRVLLPTVSRASALSQRISLGARPIWPIACLSPRILEHGHGRYACKRVLEAYESTAPETIEPAVHARPRDDHRTLPPALRDLLLADTADELEVMEEDGDPYVARVVELPSRQSRPYRCFEGFSRLVEELEAKCICMSFWRQVGSNAVLR
ncbi:MAG: hypothetical protein ACLVKA_00325 [Collinsella aerofaciens]